MSLQVALASLVFLPVVALGVSTAGGSRRRGGPWPVAVLAGVFFPVAWVAWYARDELPLRRSSSSP